MLNHLPSDAWRYVRDAPGTYLWLAALLATTLAVSRLPADRAARLRNRNSTNLDRLRHAPQVLVTSVFLVAGRSWWFYVLSYSVFHAPVEHRLGTWRWLAAVLITHVGATLVSQAWVADGIRRGRLPATMRETDDYGVSYALAGSAGLLTYGIDTPWRYGYLAAVVAWQTHGWFRSKDFTALGHLVALALGLGCFWLAG